MSKMNYGVILAGGRGERFWPLSTRKNPKQLLKLTSDKIMLEETIGRLEPLIPMDRIVVVSGVDIEDQILENTEKITKENLLLEPEGKNTCLALALAAVHIQKKDPDAVMIVLSSDHMIKPQEQLTRILKSAAGLASREDKLITIGIVPCRPETGYGYIEMGPKITEISGIKFYDVTRFKEKPERPNAQEYYLDRKHLWNSGMFVWNVKTFLKAVEKYMPSMYDCLLTYRETMTSDDNGESIKSLYRDCDNISVDFAILEKADNVLCLKGDMKWDDVGSWLALQRIYEPNAEKNVILGDVILDSSYENTIVNKTEGDIIVGFGIADLVVVKADKVIMVAHKTRVNDIKKLLSKLEKDDKYSKYL
ncbi:MAG: NTP transferase domain-containing protein [candidate division Zixibacteria bacterium]|nr:NTP transferase domain-containing protein [candidate division Zixibacteria bacterium]